MKAMKTKLFTLDGYRTALSARDLHHEMYSDGWMAANEVVRMIVTEAVERRLLWAAHEVADDIASLEELAEGNDTLNGDWMREQIEELRELLKSNRFGYMLESK